MLLIIINQPKAPKTRRKIKKQGFIYECTNVYGTFKLMLIFNRTQHLFFITKLDDWEQKKKKREKSK